MNHLTTTRRTGSKLLGARRRVASRLGPMRSRAVSVSCPLTPANSELGTQNSKLGTRVPRPALSLVELLVVIVILTILVAAVLPSLAPSSEDRRLREATRGVTAAFTKARSRALATGRPAGVELARMANEPGASMVLYQVEVPPPFAGYSDTSVVEITSNITGNNFDVEFINSSGSEPIPEGIISNGDIFRLNYQGAEYFISDLIPAGGPTYTGGKLTRVSGSAAIPWTNGQFVPYQITRQPVRTSAAPHQLPEGMVIDLHASGVGTDFFQVPFEHDVTPPDTPVQKNNDDSILVMFSPSGRLDKFTHNEVSDAAPTLHTDYVLDPVYLLVGKREKVPESPATANQGDPPAAHPYINDYTNNPNELAQNYNWKDTSSRWVVINPRTGQVSAGEVGTVLDDVSGNAGTSDGQKVLSAILASRRLARDMRSLGGN